LLKSTCTGGIRRTVAGLAVAATVLITAGCGGSDDALPPAAPATSPGWATATWDSGTSASPLPSTPPAKQSALGAKWNWSLYGQAEPYLHTLSGGSTYYEVVWCDVESSPGAANWHRIDHAVETAYEAGITTLIKIRVGRCWLTDGSVQHSRGVKGITESAMPKDLAAYRQFVTQVVERYSPYGANEFAIENEVNSPGFWDGTPEQYATLVRTAADAIHAADAKAEVVDSGISSAASGYGVVDGFLRAGQVQKAIDVYNLYYERRFGTRGDEITEAHDKSDLEAALAAEPGRRAIDYLAVTNQLVADGVIQVRQVHFYEQWSALPYLLDYLHAHTPKGVPLELWEFGSFQRDSPLTPEQRTSEVVKATAIALGAGVRKIVWLPLIARSDGRVSYQLFGLVAESGEPTPAAEAFASLSAASRGARAVPVDGGGVRGVGFEQDGKSTMFVWSTGSPVSVKVGSGSRVSPATSDGSASSTATSVRVGSDPVRVQINTTVRQFQGDLR
jgi:hypothetical protein